MKKNTWIGALKHLQIHLCTVQHIKEMYQDRIRIKKWGLQFLAEAGKERTCVESPMGKRGSGKKGCLHCTRAYRNPYVIVFCIQCWKSFNFIFFNVFQKTSFQLGWSLIWCDGVVWVHRRCIVKVAWPYTHKKYELWKLKTSQIKIGITYERCQ